MLRLILELFNLGLKVIFLFLVVVREQVDIDLFFALVFLVYLLDWCLGGSELVVC